MSTTVDQDALEAEKLSQAEIMDKLEKMHQEMFMAGHNAALKSMLLNLKHPLAALNKLADGIHVFLVDNDPEYVKELEEQENNAEKTELDSAVALAQLTAQAQETLENAKDQNN